MGPQEPSNASGQPVAPQPNQQPQPAPVPQPMQPGGVMPPNQQPMPMPMPGPVQKKGASKGLIFGIIGGVVALILLVVGVILALVVFGGPSKNDYASANVKLNEVKDSYNQLTSLEYVSTYGVTATSVQTNLDKLKSIKSNVDTGVSELGKMRAMNNKDVKASYNALEAKMPSFDTAMDTYIEVYDKIMPVVVKLDDATNSSSATSSSVMSAITATRQSLEVLNLQQEVNKTYAQGLISQIKILEDAASKYLAMKAGTLAYDSTIVSQYYAASSALTDLDKDWQSDLQKVADSGEIRDQLNNLGDVLYEKYSAK